MNWFKKARQIVISRKGVDNYLAFLVCCIIGALLLATVIEVFGVLMTKRDCEEVAGEVARYIELRGAYDSLAKSEFERLCTVDRLDAKLTVTKSGNIQLEDEFTVTVETTDYIFTVAVPLNARATGRSEVYHK